MGIHECFNSLLDLWRNGPALSFILGRANEVILKVFKYFNDFGRFGSFESNFFCFICCCRFQEEFSFPSKRLYDLLQRLNQFFLLIFVVRHRDVLQWLIEIDLFHDNGASAQHFTRLITGALVHFCPLFRDTVLKRLTQSRINIIERSIC